MFFISSFVFRLFANLLSDPAINPGFAVCSDLVVKSNKICGREQLPQFHGVNLNLKHGRLLFCHFSGNENGNRAH